MNYLIFKKLIAIGLLLSFFSNAAIFSQDISRDEAVQIAQSIINEQFPVSWTKGSANVIVRQDLKINLPFYICDVDVNGFVLVSKTKQLPKVLGFSYESDFPSDLSSVPESFQSYLEYIHTLSNSNILGEALPEEMRLEEGADSAPAFKSAFIPPLMTTKWKVDSSYCAQFPAGSMENASAVIAMGQVFRYFEESTGGTGQYCYLYGPGGLEICTNFLFEFDYSTMPDDEADGQVQQLLYYMAVTGRLQPEGADLLTYRETLPEFFTYSENMRRLEYWEHDFIPVLKHQLAMGRPVPAEWAGHNFVIDGYYDTDFFHFNFGQGGDLDGFYLLDFPNITTDKNHILLNCFINYHPKSNLPAPENLNVVSAGDSINLSWNIELPDSLSESLEKYILLKDGLIPILETTSNSVMVHPSDFGISSKINCIAVYNTYGASELSDPTSYISDYTLADIPSLELRQAINIQLGYTENLNRIPFVGELEMVKKLEIDFQDQRGINQLGYLRFLFIDGMFITGISDGTYLNGLNYMMFHRCRQFDFSVFENTNSLNVIQGSDGLPYDFYNLRHNSDAGLISFASHDNIINNMGDLYGVDRYFQELTFFDLFHITDLTIDSCYISYESYNDILPNIKGNGPALAHTSPSSFVPCYPSPSRNSNMPNTSQISWQANFNDEPSVFYNVYIGDSREQMQLVAPFYTENTFDYNFENGVDYYWRVETFHNDTTYYSGIYHFSTHETIPMPFVEGFDEYYAKCDLSYESPWWVNFGEILPEATALSRKTKRSGRYALEVPANSDVGILFNPNKDSAYQIEFYFQNNRSEFAIEFLQGSNEEDTLVVNSRIGLYGDNLGVFDFGESSGQFLFNSFDWNHAELLLDMPAGLGILTVNENEIARWNWNLQIDGASNLHAFRGIRFSNATSTGSGFIDDIQVEFTESTGMDEMLMELPEISYSSFNHELILSGNVSQITGIELFDLRGRKIITFANNGEQKVKLDESIQDGVFIVRVRYRGGNLSSQKISVYR